MAFDKDAIDRLECDCHLQVLRVLAVFRLWNCTKGWKQEPPWPTEVDPNDWPPWRTGGGPKVDYIQGASKAERCSLKEIDFDRKDNTPGSGNYGTTDPDFYDPSHYRDGKALYWRENGPRQNWGRGLRVRLTWSDFETSDPDKYCEVTKSCDMWNVDWRNKGERPGTKTYFDYNELRRDVVAEYKSRTHNGYMAQEILRGFDRFDPFTWDLHYAIELIENFGGEVPDIIGFSDEIKEVEGKEWSHQHVPKRLDACLCEQLLRCPNGTTSIRGAGSIFDCQKANNEVLRRVVPATPDSPSWDRVINATDRTELSGDPNQGVGKIDMYGFEVATFTMDLRKLEVNMTYDLHYQFSVYHDCTPCPVRYQCRADDSGCIFPDEKRQAELGYMCYSEDELNPGCCMCKRKRMPYYFEDTTNGLPEAFTPPIMYDYRFDMFPDNKHDIQQVSVGAIHDTSIVFAIELVHGLYYGSFADTMTGIGQFNMFTPSRSIFNKDCSERCKYTPNSLWNPTVEWGGVKGTQFEKAGQCEKLSVEACNTASFLAIIKFEDFDGKLYAPLNLPLADENKFELEQTVFIDRIADWWVGDPLYIPVVYNDSNDTTAIMEAAGSLATYEAEQKKEEAINETLATKKVERQNGFLQRFAKRDSLVLRAVDSTWWKKAQDQQGVEFMALPYLPFFLTAGDMIIMSIFRNCLKTIPIVHEDLILRSFWNIFGTVMLI